MLELVFVGLSLHFEFDALGYEQGLYFRVTDGMGGHIYAVMQGGTSYFYGFLQLALLVAWFDIPGSGRRRIMEATTPEGGCSRRVHRYCSRRR